MPRRVASVALLFVFAGAIGTAAAATDAAATKDVERMTPAQLRTLQAELDRQSAATRGENAVLSRRIRELEQRKAADDAKQAELEARLADVLARLASLKGKVTGPGDAERD